MNIPHARTTLANGLSVIVHEDRRCPIVAVDIWYHVGSKNERPGRTGFAHLFEHLMFEGSEHYDRGYFHPLQQAGAALNGSTNTDRTNYWEVVPTNALDLALWMESDRMGGLLLTPAKFENQREVVLNERRQNYENRPYGLAGMAILGALFPPAHPYHWMTIGEADDLRAAAFEEVKEFFRTYYHPGTASLVLAGDIDTERGFALARQYFEDIPRGPVPPPVVVPPSNGLRQGTRLVLEDRVELARLYLSWHTPALFADGDAEYDLLGAVLGHGKTSRLYRALVYDTRMATEVVAMQSSRELAGFFQVMATCAPEHDPAALHGVISDEIARLAADGPTAAELERAQAQVEAHFVYRLQNVGGFGGKADQLNAYNVFAGDPAYFARDLARYRAVTAEGLRAAAARLQDGPSVTLSLMPSGQRDRALPGSMPAVVA